MIYYLFIAIIDIGWYLWDNKLNLTFTLVASGVGVILGKRLGTRIAINYIMRTLGLEQKSKLEKKVDWLIEQEKARGNVWNVPTLPSERNGLVERLKLLHKVGWLARFVRFTTRPRGIYQLLRRMIIMHKLKSRKFLMAVVGAILIILNEGLDMGINSETVLAFAGLLAVWISGESYVDGKRAEGVPNEPDYTKADSTSE